MNSTVDSNDDSTNNTGGLSIGGFGYGIGVSVGVLLLIIIITYASYLCTRRRIPARANNPSSHISSLDTTTDDDDDSITFQQALDEATLLSYPKLLYSQAKLHHGHGGAASGCSICLADYKDSDMLRLLPECGHLFHLNCIDPWLRLHPTCPICRNSPVATPLSGVVPLPT